MFKTILKFIGIVFALGFFINLFSGDKEPINIVDQARYGCMYEIESQYGFNRAKWGEAKQDKIVIAKDDGDYFVQLNLRIDNKLGLIVPAKVSCEVKNDGGKLIVKKAVLNKH